MPQFEIAREGQDPAFVRARDAAGAVGRHASADGHPPDITLSEAEQGTGWQTVTVGGAPWGRVRPRDRMRFRRD